MSRKLHDLRALVRGLPRPAVAVSGGVDSMTLATLVHQARSGDVLMAHAVSPAVPGTATDRVTSEAARQGWTLRLVDAHEFADEAYRANPSNRCFFCKSNLYATIAALGDHVILSGTNCDDLEDVRPGLEASRNQGVRHPFVETGFRKADVRALARTLSLGDIAELPASPCLSSRIETGRWIEPAELKAVERIEELVRGHTAADTVRCRVRADRVVVELSPFGDRAVAALEALRPAIVAAMTEAGLRLPLVFAPYRRGSAFLDQRQS